MNQPTAALGRPVTLREDTRDRQVWADTFSGLYHVPPLDMPTPKTVLDLGANIGLTVAHYSQLWPEARIVAVEMDDRNADLIPVNAPGVDIVRVAVADQMGWATYDGGRASDAYSISRPPEEIFTYTRETTVVALAYLIENQFDGPVDFVKMDIEGAEWDLLWNHADWSPLVKNIIVELHADARALDNEHALALGWALLAAAGFEPERTNHPCGLFGRRA